MSVAFGPIYVRSLLYCLKRGLPINCRSAKLCQALPDSPKRSSDMPREQTVIYATASSQKAHLLRELLGDSQVEAVVVDKLPRQGSGGDNVSQSVPFGVAVANHNAPRARRIAMDFDQEGVRAAERAARVEAPALPGAWPKCPECDAPRSTRCPICETAGTDFAPVDMGFSWIADLDDAAAAAAAAGSCSCGPHGCSSGGPAAETDMSGGDRDPGEDGDPSKDGPDWAASMLICPTCDEPFRPEYPRQCQWCGHEFDEGFDVDVQLVSGEWANARVVAVISALLVLLLALAVYFMLVVSPG
ncbi:MAG: hypothetical protein A2V70_09465 [Planctomycetes bacterium RBG_13_63_9]|nr:MAG: hypothetical protein A2V70_09465 [Planctomycetes bacterium RBG_13_63_9]